MSKVVPNWHGKILCNCGETIETELSCNDIVEAAQESVYLTGAHPHETNVFKDKAGEHFPVLALFKKVK